MRQKTGDWFFTDPITEKKVWVNCEATHYQTLDLVVVVECSLVIDVRTGKVSYEERARFLTLRAFEEEMADEDWLYVVFIELAGLHVCPLRCDAHKHQFEAYRTGAGMQQGHHPPGDWEEITE